MTTTNLETVARNMFADIIGDTGADIDAIRDEISERSHDAADNACIYYSACEDIISRYESDARADTDSADDMDATFKPSQYLEAMQSYAYFIARSIIEAEAYSLADGLETSIDEICSIVFNDPAIRHIRVNNDIRLSADCPHGWAAHDYENDMGACFWVSRQLDGCNAVALPAAGVWLSYTWE